jgi:hypothetical protein
MTRRISLVGEVRGESVKGQGCTAWRKSKCGRKSNRWKSESNIYELETRRGLELVQ